MAVVGSAEVLVRPSFKGFQTNVASQMASASRAGSNTFAKESEKAGIGRRIGGSIGRGLLTTAKVTGGAVAGILSLSLVKGFQRLNSIEQAQAKLKGLGNSAKDVKNIMANALASVKGTAFGLDEAATVAASAVAAGIKPGQQLTKYLRLTADAATIAGVSMADMGSILNQVTASGKAQNDTLKQLSDKGIPVYQMLGKELGKSAGQIFNMASKGKISAEQLQTALQKGVGGAALSAGDTVQGSFKNMGAALARFGAAFLDKLFPRFQKGFVNITAFIDHATKAVGPLAAVIGDKLGGAFVRVTAVLARIKFDSWDSFLNSLAGPRGKGTVSRLGRIVSGVKGVYDILAKGSFAGAKKTFGWAEDSRPVDFLFTLREELIKFGKAAKTWFQGIDFGGILHRIGDAAKSVGPLLGRLMRALPSAASGAGKGVLNFLDKSSPAFSTFGDLIRKIGSTAGTILAKALGFINDHFDTLMKILPAAVLAYIAYRKAQEGMAAAQLAVNAAQLKALPLTTANNALRVVAEFLARSNRKALVQETVATEENTAAKSRGMFTMIKTAAVWVAQRGAMLASAAAQKAVTAAQWLMNAAMSANPIGLVVIAVAALVAGFIIAYKKSATFRKIVNGALNAVKAAAVAVWHWFTRSFVPFFTKTLPGAFNSVVTWVKRHWPLILGLLTGPIGLAVGQIIKHRDKIESAFRAAWTWVSGTFKRLWGGVQKIFTAPISGARDFFSATFGSGGKARGIFTSMKGWATGTFSRTWAKVKDTFTHPVDSAKRGIATILGVTGLQKVFRGAVSAIGRIWAGLKKLFSGPVKWIVDNVINKVLIAGINKIGNFVGLGGKDRKVLGTLSTAGLATGGVFMPQRYTPGRDIGLAALSGSEAVMRPEFTKAVGGRWVDRANKAARQAGIAGVRRFLGTFAGGGIVKPTRSGRMNPSYPGHSGIDFFGRDGDPILAATAGRITYEGSGRGYGNAIFETAANGLQMVYGHTSRILARIGQMVRAGQEIGLVGHSGNVRPPGPAGAHLHFEVAPTGQFDLSSNRQATLNWLGGSSIVSRIIGAVTGAGRALLDPSKLLTTAVQKALGVAGDVLHSPFGQILAKLPGTLAGKAVDWAKSKLSGIFNPGGAGAEQWRGVISTALQMNGLPTSADFVNAWLRQVNTESRGNPRAIQGISDVNSASGNLARGLLQVIPPTFRAFMFPGHGDIFNPLDNALAAIHYALNRYGRNGMLRAIGAGHGYANGTLNARPGWHLVGEREPEWVRFRGGEEVYNGKMIAAMGGGSFPDNMRLRGALDLGHGLIGLIDARADTRADARGRAAGRRANQPPGGLR